MEQSIIYVGLDVHKDTIAVALAEAGLREEVREHGKISNSPAALKALTEKLAGKRTTECNGARMRRGRAVVDPPQTRRSDQNGPP
jgi:hypothetical protein